MTVTLTQEQAQALCREWQERLRLQDWDVKMVIARRDDIGDDRQGECEYVQSKRQAVISLLDPVDYPPGPWEQDHEVDLVHELGHLHFAPFMSDKGDDDPEHIAQEQAIEAYAKALVALKRAGGGQS